MNSHIHVRLLARGHDSVKKVYEIFKEFLVSHTFVRFQKSVKFVGGVTFVPTGQTQIAFVEFFEIGFRIRKRRRTVGMLIV